MNDYPAHETSRIGDGLVWTGIVTTQLVPEHSSPALDGVDLFDSEIFDSPWDDLSGGTTRASGRTKMYLTEKAPHFRIQPAGDARSHRLFRPLAKNEIHGIWICDWI